MILLFALVKPDVYVFLGPHRYALRKIFICEVAGFADCVSKTRNLTYRRLTKKVELITVLDWRSIRCAAR